MGREITFTIHYHGGPKDGGTDKLAASVLDAAADKVRTQFPRYVKDEKRTAQDRNGHLHVQWMSR